VDHKISIGLVEDQFLFRQGMKAILSGSDNLEVIFESADGYSVIDKLKQMPRQPDVLLVDFSLPADPQSKREYSGREVTVAIRASFPDIKIIILSVHEDENFIADAIEHGAHGYLVKDSDPGEVFDAIQSVYTKGSYINERALKALQKNINKKTKPRPVHPDARLTRREEEVLELVCQQLTAEEIAERLFISVKTVNGHRTNLLEKTGAKNVAGLVIYAIRNNIVTI